jgi:hypothetical protein
MVEIRLNGTLLELSEDKDLTYTLQVNDIGDVATRQASYTNSFKLPKTKINTETMQGLGQVGDTSRIPYQKPTCELSQDGFPIIPNGWAVIKNTDDNYSLNITNGIIDFFKAIENKTLGIHLDLSEINHEKTVATVVNSFTAGLPYRYLIADYNGKTHYDVGNKILIDYLPPSASVEYLWNKISTTFGFTFIGTVFNDIRFKDLWLTYPKGISENLSTTEIYNVNTGLVSNRGLVLYGGYFTVSSQIQIIIEFLPYQSPSVFTGYILRFYLNNILYVGLPNQILILNTNDVFYFTKQDYTSTISNINYGTEIVDYSKVKSIKKYNTLQSFSEELKEFKITDFVKEILNKFCLTMFTDSHSKNIHFKTIKERTETTNIIDWSDKFVDRKNETYIFDTYAQKNNFRYQYNDKEDAHNDGSILIDNVNIADSIDVWKSITYSPLKETNDNFLIGTATLPPIKIFKQYEKEVKEAPIGSLAEIKYKPLSKRFYFQRSEQINGTAIFGSVLLSNEQTITNGLIQIANFNQLDMNSIIGLSYLPLQSILNDSRLHTIILVLSVFDIMTIDFTALYYFNQEQQYYLLNKIVYKSGELATAEFVRVKR